MSETTRRTVLTGAAAASASVALAACSKDETPVGGGSQPTTGSTATTAPTATAGGSSPTPGGSRTAGGGPALASVSDIPVGGGKIFATEKVVVTQPTAGTIKAFSAICTHQGCTVGDVSGGTINCPCHLSKYKVSDGSVVSGPAPRPLAAAKVTVAGGQISLG